MPDRGGVFLFSFCLIFQVSVFPISPFENGVILAVGGNSVHTSNDVGEGIVPWRARRQLQHILNWLGESFRGEDCTEFLT